MYLSIVSKVRETALIYEKLKEIGIREGDGGFKLFVSDCEDVCKSSAKEITPLLFTRSFEGTDILYLIDSSEKAIEDLITFLKDKIGTLSLHFTGLKEPEFKKFLEDLQLEELDVTLQMKRIPGGLTCDIKYLQKHKAEKVAEKIRKALHAYEFISNKGSLADALQNLMIEKGMTLTLAESCTGGFLSHLVTKNPGSSKYFLGSFVTYSNRLKTSILDVPKELLEEEGAVSSPVAQKMLEGALIKADADVGIAVSGVAGPDGDKPIGTVWFALGDSKDPEIGCLHLTGDREEIIKETAYTVLGVLYRKVRCG